MGPSLPLTAVEDDTDIAPVLKVSTQFSIKVQTAAGDYEEKHAYVPRRLIGHGLGAGQPPPPDESAIVMRPVRDNETDA